MLNDLLISNAAGTVKNMYDLGRMCRSAATQVKLGSITLLPRAGNLPAPRSTYYYDPRTRASINALGLNNQGLEAYERQFQEMKTLANDCNKRFDVSVAGFSTDQFIELVGRCATASIPHIELNLGCPNIHVGGKRKPIFSLDPELTEEVLMSIRGEVGDGRAPSIGVKISPIEDEQLLLKIANAITRSGIVREVVACNTIPDQRIILDDGSDALAFQSEESGPVLHTGGLAGTPLREISLQVVKTLRSIFGTTMRIKCVGGISKGEHMKDALEAGADGFECATACIERGPIVFSDIFEEYSTLSEEEIA